MADKNYYPQPQGDSSQAEALKHVTIVNVAIDADSRVGPYYPGNAKSIVIVSTDLVSVQVRGGGSPGPAASVFRNAQVQYADIQNPTASKAGMITGAAMPHEFYLLDTADDGVNPTTIYFNY
tara:strand:- start:576 stop:941 length:366 start_codon:yes stop_codon:yes gene_type:complete